MAYRKSEYFSAEVWGTEHEVQDFSGGGAVVGGVFGDDDQVCFIEDVVEYNARVLGAVLDEMRGRFQGCIFYSFHDCF